MRLIPFAGSCLPSRERRMAPGMFRFFDDVMSEWPMTPTFLSRENLVPPVDILEKDGNVILRCELPGIEEKDIDLKLEGNLLTLKGEKKIEEKENRADYQRVESFVGTFSRSFTLPGTVDTSGIKADYKNGVLTITIPQKAEVRPREIPVNA